MSFSLKCDICGKTEESNGVKFDSRPLMIQLVNHKKQPYNVFLSIGIEHASDTAMKEELFENRNNAFEKMMMEAFKNGAIIKQVGNPESANVTPVPIEAIIQNKMKNPSPTFCTKCKRHLAQYAVHYGLEGELVKF